MHLTSPANDLGQVPVGARAVRGGGESFEVNATFDVEVATLSIKRRLSDADDDDDVSGVAGLRSKMAAVTMKRSGKKLRHCLDLLSFNC